MSGTPEGGKKAAETRKEHEAESAKKTGNKSEHNNNSHAHDKSHSNHKDKAGK